MKLCLFSLPLIALLVSSCGHPVYYETPREWNPPSKRDSLVQSYRPFLEGRKIFLDPGHGGEDRSGRGPSGVAIEADVNLRVALALRDDLDSAGAVVTLSRTKDTTIALADRQVLAQASGAEIFISLHHNDTGTPDHSTNYSSVYYHATPGDPDYHPADRDLARFIERDMSYAMRKPAPPSSPTFDGTLSDYGIYPGRGFAVLRDNPLPAVLIEASFFSHPTEEERLAREEYNQIEAWGIFLGLARYFRTGIPELTLQSDSAFSIPRPVILIGFHPWQNLDRCSIEAKLDGEDTPWTLIDSLQAIALQPAVRLKSGPHELGAIARSSGGNASWPFRKTIYAMLPPAELAVRLHPSPLPPEAGAVCRVTVSARDSSGNPVADGTPIRIRAASADLDTVVMARQGEGVVYLSPAPKEGSVPIEVYAGLLSERVTLLLHRGERSFVGGKVLSHSSGLPISGAVLTFMSEEFETDLRRIDTTIEDGRYLIADTLKGNLLLRVTRPGYFPYQERLVTLLGTSRTIELWPVAAGRLLGKKYWIDGNAGETREAGEGEIVRGLQELLEAAGAESSPAPDSSRWGKQGREHPERPLHLRITADLPEDSTFIELPRRTNWRPLGEAILQNLATFAGLDTLRKASEGTPRARRPSLAEIHLPSAASGEYAKPGHASRIAWAIFVGILESEGFDAHNSWYQAIDGESGAHRGGVPVVLGGTLTQIADSDGKVNFFGLDIPEVRPVVPGRYYANLQQIP